MHSRSTRTLLALMFVTGALVTGVSVQAAGDPPDIAAVTVMPSPTTAVSVDSTAPGPSPASTEDGPLDIAGARAGLEALVGTAADTGPNEPLTECPVVGRSVMNGALETAGVDTPLADWRVEIGPVDTGGPTWNEHGITCTGAYVGAERDESIPELRASLIVVDLGDSAAFEQFLVDVYPGATDPMPTPAIGGATRGECADIDRTDRCVEFWEHDGFVVGVLLADRVFMDRPTASAVLNELVPAVVTSLTSDAPDETADDIDPLDGMTDEQIIAAMVGLNELVGGAGIRPIDFGDCPILREADIETSLTDRGISIDLGDWDETSSIVPNAAGDAAIPGVLCRGADGDEEVQLFVNVFGDDASADEFIADLGGCESVAELQYCLVFGQRDGFVVGIGVLAAADELTADDAEAVLAEVVPIVLDNLAGAS